MDFEMGRWAGLSSLIDFHFESLPGHHFHFTRNRNHRSHNLSSHQHSQSSRNGMPTVTLSTKYHKLDDSIFVLCKNCGHSLKTEELRKMAAQAGPAPTNRFRQNPKHFFTWSATAANNRLQKLSKNFVNNVSKLQSKMERALPFQNQQGLTSQVNNNNIHSQCHNNGGFCDEPLSCPTVTTLTHSPKLHKTARNNENQLTMSSSMKRQSISNSSGSSASLVANMATSEPTTVVIKTARKTQHYNLNNGFHSSTSNSNNNSSESNNNSPTELNSCRKLGEKPPLVKSLGDVDIDVLEMRPVSRKSSSTASKYNLSNNSSCSNNTSLSSNLFTATTLPIVSPQWSRASSISTIGPSTAATITSTSQQQQNCDNSSVTNRSNSSSSKMNTPNVNVSGGSRERDGGGKVLQQLNLNSPHQLPNQHELEDSCSNSLNSSASTTTDSSTTPLISATTNNNSTTTNTTNNNKSASDCRNNNNSSSNNNHSPNNNISGLLPTLKNPLATSTPTSKLAITIFEEEAELRHAPWFQAGIPREIALEVLRNEPIGSFIVRESTTKSGCFALSLRVPREFQPTGIAHYLILRTGRGYKIKGFTKEFGSLSSLITHHSVMPELLPCPLSLHRYRPKHAHRVSRINSSDFVEPEKLITFRKFTDF